MGFYTVLLVIHTIIVLFLIMMVLIQRSDGDGLGGLGGGGGNQFLTGRSQANLLTRTTAILATAFMTTSLVLAIMASRMTESSIVDTISTQQESAPVEAPAETPKAPAVPKPE
jgi:preprotein translocase subunit SecG